MWLVGLREGFDDERLRCDTKRASRGSRVTGAAIIGGPLMPGAVSARGRKALGWHPC
jgi:hypothetical protein